MQLEELTMRRGGGLEEPLGKGFLKGMETLAIKKLGVEVLLCTFNFKVCLLVRGLINMFLQLHESFLVHCYYNWCFFNLFF